MRRPFLAVVAAAMSSVLLCLPLPGAAQDPGGIIMDLLQRKMQREIERQQRREQRQYNQQLNEAFLVQWNACFNGDLYACDQALGFQGVVPDDYQRLLAQRESIVAAQEALEREARQQEFERAQELERQRQAEVERRRAEADRLRGEREQEERRTAALRAFNFAYEGCRRYVVSSCDAALASALANEHDRSNLRILRATAEKYQADRAACKGRSSAACDAALASPAVETGDRAQLETWRTESSPVHRTTAFIAELGTTAVGKVQSVAAAFRDLPTSTHVTGAIALLLAAALALVGVRRQGPSLSGGSFLRRFSSEAGHEPDRGGTGEGHQLRAPPAAALPSAALPRAALASAALAATAPAGASLWTSAAEAPAVPERRPTPMPAAVKASAPPSAQLVPLAAAAAPIGRLATDRLTEESDPQSSAYPSVGPSVGQVLGNAGVFVVFYILLMIPTYWLPYLGSNSTVLNAAGMAAKAGPNPLFWLHLAVMLLLATLAWLRGRLIDKSWLVIFPILALVFDLAPGLNWVPLVPTVMHLLAIIMGVASAAPPGPIIIRSPGAM